MTGQHPRPKQSRRNQSKSESPQVRASPTLFQDLSSWHFHRSFADGDATCNLFWFPIVTGEIWAVLRAFESPDPQATLTCKAPLKLDLVRKLATFLQLQHKQPQHATHVLLVLPPGPILLRLKLRASGPGKGIQLSFACRAFSDHCLLAGHRLGTTLY